MARSPFVDLDRRFRVLTAEEREDPEVLAQYTSLLPSLSDGWAQLLKDRRVVILAEAGAGKTREMREQVARMVEAATPAFLLPLEALQREPPRELMSESERARYEAWLADDTQMVWFFLDSVDELKLVHGTLDRALRRLGRDVEGRLGRLSVVLSSRPTDWRQSTDLEALETHLPVPDASDEVGTSPAAFLEPLKRDGDRTKAEAIKAEPYVVGLLPLGEKPDRAFCPADGDQQRRSFPGGNPSPARLDVRPTAPGSE